MGQLCASDANRSHGASTTRSPTPCSVAKGEGAESPDRPAQAVVQCALAKPLIGQPESRLAGSGGAGSAQSGQVTIPGIAMPPSAQGAEGALAPANGLYIATSNASKSARERCICRR